MDAYVINLKRITERMKNITKRFKKTDLNDSIYRWEATDGVNLSSLDLNQLNFFPYYFTPRSAIGCAHSHISLNQYLFENDKNEAVLVLEDDVYPNIYNIKKECLKIIKYYNKNFPDWDTIKLHQTGIPFSTPKINKFLEKLLTGSTAAYIVSKKGQSKIANMKPFWHIDTDFNFSNLNQYQEINRNIFTVNIWESGSEQIEWYPNKNSSNELYSFGLPFSQTMSWPIFYTYYTGNISPGQVISFLSILCICLLFYYHNSNKKVKFYLDIYFIIGILCLLSFFIFFHYWKISPLLNDLDQINLLKQKFNKCKKLTFN